MRRILTSLLLVCLLTGCGALARGGAIVLPDAEKISKVTVNWGGRTASSGDKTYIKLLLDVMKTAKNTGSASVQDAPAGAAWLARIDFAYKSSGTSTVFLYPKAGRLYLEQPYEGIYEADGALAALVWEVGK